MYVILWKFLPKPGSEGEFEKAYGPNGIWARLFIEKGEGFVGTELLKAADGHYITIDRWTSSEAYENFRKNNAAEYKKIDESCETLTGSETPLGTFVSLPK